MSKFIECMNTLYTCYYNCYQKMKKSNYADVFYKNSAFKGKYKNKRCFILGNGPSLKQLDFSILKDEYTFTVNQLFKNENFHKLETNFHVFTDMEFMNCNNPVCCQDEYIQDFSRINPDKKTNIFLTIKVKEYVDKYNLDSILGNVHYIDDSLSFFRGDFNKIDLTKKVYDFPTVVMQCIQIAIYMGFTKIYLLGCDCTGIIGLIQAAQKESVTTYAYTLSSGDEKRMEFIKQKRSFEAIFRSWADIFRDYRWINEYCKHNGIEIINCTENSILDSIPKESIYRILRE